MSKGEKTVRVMVVREWYDGLQKHKKDQVMTLPESIVYKKQKDGKFLVDKNGEKIMCGCFAPYDTVITQRPMPGPTTRPVQDAVQKSGDDVI